MRHSTWRSHRLKGPGEPDAARLFPPGGPAGPTLRRMESVFRSLLGLLQDADALPTSQALEASAAARGDLALVVNRWNAIRGGRLAAVNEMLHASHLPLLGRD